MPFAFFGSCILVYFFGRILAKKLCHLTTDEQTVFGMATVFSNNVQLGVPISIALLSPASMPALAVIFALNAFLMWTFATVQIEFSRSRSPSLSRTIYQGTMRSLRNPIVIGIILGLLWSLTGLEMPVPLKKTVDLMANAASPVALFAVGVGLTQYKLRSHFETTGLITVLKLGVQPVVVFLLGHLMGLTGPELQAVCLLGCPPGRCECLHHGAGIQCASGADREFAPSHDNSCRGNAACGAEPSWAPLKKLSSYILYIEEAR